MNLSPFQIFVIIYCVILNIVSFVTMFLDKKKAIHRQYRIPERTLFIEALIGGALGSILGMYTFRHKTKHLSFVIGMPLILVVNIYLYIKLF